MSIIREMFCIREAFVCFSLTVLVVKASQAQFLIENIDTSNTAGKRLLAILKKTDYVEITGYLQPQFQVAQQKGVDSYSGGDFEPNTSNRFMLRRGRIRFEYAHFTDASQPSFQVVFQFDGTERGVNIRDFWGRLYENKFQLFSLTTGMFARPFGYEINLSSANRESPERGRMSQILMQTERDMGAMISFEPRNRKNEWQYVKLDFGLFNGQGLTGPNEYDSFKDVIMRGGLRRIPISSKVQVSAAGSLLRGGFVQNSRYVYRIEDNNGQKMFVADSSLVNVGRKAPRRYNGADAQVRIDNHWGETELRAEYWWGTQTATLNSSHTPGLLLDEPYFIRNFNGAFFYVLQFLAKKHQVGIKYDWYDPNTDLEGKQIGAPGNGGTKADIKFSTLSLGYIYYMKPNMKWMIWYDMIRNETTSVNEYQSDKEDNIFTVRLQFSF